MLGFHASLKTFQANTVKSRKFEVLGARDFISKY